MVAIVICLQLNRVEAKRLTPTRNHNNRMHNPTGCTFTSADDIKIAKVVPVFMCLFGDRLVKCYVIEGKQKRGVNW